jgi:putative FmdB family regulatory protein
MPIYTYECKNCGAITESIYKVADRPEQETCHECGGDAGRILSSHGAIHSDNDVKWLPSACKVLLKPGERPLTTRTEWKAYLKKNHLIATG